MRHHVTFSQDIAISGTFEDGNLLRLSWTVGKM